MSDAERRYNGWTNYETWAYALWQDNGEGSCESAREQAREAYRNAEPTEHLTRAESAAIDLASTLKSECEQVTEAIEGVQHNLFGDLLSAAISEIDFDAIATSLIGEISSEIDAEEADTEAEGDE